MSEEISKAWYRKYRPVTMEDYMGDDIKYTVENRFTVPENRPNVFMLHGNRGCGKTSFARIISKYYLCENPHDGKPCEECEICRTINEALIDGEAGVEVPGVVEVDATTANGKEAIQNIIEEAIIPPIYTKFKILILDECHMITKAAQNSLLKIIEDVPEHLIVIFATTDPEDVIGTIHSRCQIKLEVKKKSVKEMADRLMYIAQQEGLHTSIEALEVIAKKADRVPRECINLLENIAKSYGGEVTLDTVRRSTGSVAEEVYMKFFESANSGLEDILLFNKLLKDMDISASNFVSGLTRFTLDCLYIRHMINIEDYPLDYVEQVKKIFETYTSSEFDTLLQVIEHAYKMLGSEESRNELVVTTTALRIGKIGLLSGGLADTVVEAEAENKQSLAKHKAKIQQELTDSINNVHTISATKEKISELINNISEVKTSKLHLDPVDNTDDTTSKDGFLSASELANLIN